MENISHTMELLGAFLTGVVGPVAYFLVNRYFQKHKESKRDKIKEKGYQVDDTKDGFIIKKSD